MALTKNDVYKENPGGLRYNEGKLRYDLIPVFALEQVAKVFTYGANKYEPNNWRKGLSWTGCLASLERHLQAFKRGEDLDPESQLMHMAHLAVNALFLLEYSYTHPELDDRIKYNRDPLPSLGTMPKFSTTSTDTF